MSDLHVKYLLVGGGAASFAAASSIRAIDPQGPILLVGQEINRPYYRTALSKGFLRHQTPRTALFTCEPDWFHQHNVRLRTSCRAVHLDTSRSIAQLDSGESVTYDRLLLATGAVPRHLGLPGEHLPNIYYLRAIEDAERLHGAIEKANREGRRHAPAAGAVGTTSGSGGSHQARGHAVVIGAGLMGVEIAACIAQSGVAVDLVAGASHPWSKFAGEATGNFLSHYLTRCGLAASAGGQALPIGGTFLHAGGLTVHEGVRAARVEGDGRAQRVILSDGRKLDCDFLVAAVGAVPNKDLLRGTGIIAETAILADEHCRTNVPDVYAAGDCAAVRDPIFHKHRPAGQWDTAAATGAIAGRNMAGESVAISAITTFTTELFGLTCRAWGSSRHLGRRILRGTPNVESPEFVEIGVGEDGRISQVLAFGANTAGGQAAASGASNVAASLGTEKVFEELVRRRVGIDGNEELVKDPGWGLECLLG